MKEITHCAIVLMAGAALLIGMPAVAAGPASDKADAVATYQAVFVPSWNPASHPFEYPVTHAKKGLLTPIIGATHGKDFRIFAAGQLPSAGLERLSEMGMHSPLDSEIQKAIADGKAGSLIVASEGSAGLVHVPVTLQFEASAQFSLVSLVGMIAPSPDWFYGVSAVELLKDGNWLSSVSVTAYAWDSGGDGGSTYMAEDLDLSPKVATQLVGTAHFSNGKSPIPVGVFVIKRVPSL